MRTRSLTYFLFVAAPITAAADPEDRLNKLEQNVAELQTLVRALDLRGREFTPPPAAPQPSQFQNNTSAQQYLIRTGDSFWSIARKHHLSVRSLQDANPSLDPRRLPIGEYLQIPGKTVEPTIPDNVQPEPVSAPVLPETITNIEIISTPPVDEFIAPAPPQLEEVIPTENEPAVVLEDVAPPLSDEAPLAEETQLAIEDTEVQGDSNEEAESTQDLALSETQPLEADAEQQSTMLITVEGDMPLSAVASSHETSVATLNALNELDLSPEQMIKTGSQLYVPGR